MRKLFIGIILAAFGLVLMPKAANASSVINSRIDLTTGEIALGVVDDAIQDEWRVHVSTTAGSNSISLGNVGTTSILAILNQACYKEDGSSNGECSRTLNDRQYTFTFDAYKNGEKIEGAEVVYHLDLSGMPDNPTYKQWYQSTTDPNGGSLGVWTGHYTHYAGDDLDVRRFFETIISNSLRAPDDSEFDHLEIDGEPHDLDSTYLVDHDFTIKIFWRASSQQPDDDDDDDEDDEDEKDPATPAEEESKEEGITNPDTAVGEIVELDEEAKGHTSLFVILLGVSVAALALFGRVVKKRR